MTGIVTDTSTRAPQFFPHLNLLRAFAALSVLVYHVIEHYGWASFPTAYGLIWFKIGWMSVDLFFVISGFVISLSLIQLHETHQKFLPLAREFLWRRLGRIVPLYVLTLFVYAAAVQPDLLGVQGTLWLHWLSHLTFTHPLLPQSFGSINGINWSVGVEMHFYIIALVTSPLWVRRKPLTLFLSGVALAWTMRGVVILLGQHLGWQGSQFFAPSVQAPMMLDEFAAGGALALLIHHCPPAQWRLKGGMLAAVVIAALTLSLFIYWQDSGYWHNPKMVIFWRSSIAIAFGLLIAFFCWLPAFKTPPLWYRALFYLGDISYGIYLWHLTVILLAKPHLETQPGLALLVIIPAVIALSSLSWHWLEKPAIRYSKQRSRISRG